MCIFLSFISRDKVGDFESVRHTFLSLRLGTSFSMFIMLLFSSKSAWYLDSHSLFTFSLPGQVDNHCAKHGFFRIFKLNFKNVK